MKKNKKIGVVLAAVIVVFLLGAVTSMASATTVEISDARADPGATTTTTVTAYDVVNLGNFGIALTFDPNVVNVTDITDGPGVGTFIWQRHNNETVRFFTRNWGVGEPVPSLSGDVLLATLTLHAVGNAGDESPLNIEILTLVDNENQVIPATPVNGTFIITTLDTLVEYIVALDDDAFDNNPNQRKKVLSDKIEKVRLMIEAGDYEKAIKKLEDIRDKADGSLGGNPKNDWITDSTAKAEICAMIDELIADLEALL